MQTKAKEKTTPGARGGTYPTVPTPDGDACCAPGSSTERGGAMIKERTAHDAFVENAKKARGLLADIRSDIAMMVAEERHDKRDWGFAGSMSYVIEQLCYVHDHLTNVDA